MKDINILADESVDYRIIKSLRNKGYTIDAIIENNKGITDEQVLKFAYENCAVLLTEDKDFGELTYRLQIPSKGIVLIRMNGVEINEKVSKILKVLKHYNKDIINSFMVITQFKVRIKKL